VRACELRNVFLKTDVKPRQAPTTRPPSKTFSLNDEIPKPSRTPRSVSVDSSSATKDNTSFLEDRSCGTVDGVEGIHASFTPFKKFSTSTVAYEPLTTPLPTIP
jgi:hypothetical protein